MSLIKDEALQVGRQLQNLLDRSAEDMQQLPEMTASTLPEAGWPCEPTLTLPPALPCQLTHRCPAGVERGVAVPAGKGNPPGGLGRARHWPGRTSAPAEPKARGSGWKQETHGHWQAVSVLYDLASPSSLFIHVILHIWKSTSFKNTLEENHRERICSFKEIDFVCRR